ncbi:hypothetical protein BGW38_000549 [Lunasporangiospora selenospora]|uniref:Uncharacterized protein n=1 Tax=Lunasporangiospora selenospora TaxID=979761 RepID=A0A9P6FV56_9FUNG|nr:hypothetical protein BGW38_000549 [Lunasporangiospora selenospora]
MRIENKVAVITGASSGFGKNLAKRLVGKGAKVVLADLNIKEGEQLAQELNKSKSTKVAVFIQCNVTDDRQLRAAIDKAQSEFGGFDIMINNAGIIEKRHLFADETENWKAVLDVNLTAVVNGTRLAVDAFRRQGKKPEGSVVVNTASIAGLGPFAMAPAYTASKYGVVGLTQTFRRDLILSHETIQPTEEKKRDPRGGENSAYEAIHELGIRVNAVAPAWAITGLVDGIRETVDKMAITVPVERVMEAFEMLIENDDYCGNIAVVLQNKPVYIHGMPVSTSKL